MALPDTKISHSPSVSNIHKIENVYIINTISTHSTVTVWLCEQNTPANKSVTENKRQKRINKESISKLLCNKTKHTHNNTHTKCMKIYCVTLGENAFCANALGIVYDSMHSTHFNTWQVHWFGLGGRDAWGERKSCNFFVWFHFVDLLKTQIIHVVSFSSCAHSLCVIFPFSLFS